MANISSPSTGYIGYWRPWNKDSDANDLEGYLSYAKDASLAKYSADVVGEYIKESSTQHIEAINKLGMQVGLGMNILSDQLSSVNVELYFLNRNIELQIEQQKITNDILGNIAELLKVPDSEKERQKCIELGLKFFSNARKDSDLLEDALEQFLKAEILMKQDYFVLHRIGLIYLSSSKHISPKKALEYFTKAAKYAVVDDDPKSKVLSNQLFADELARESFLTKNDVIQIVNEYLESYENYDVEDLLDYEYDETGNHLLGYDEELDTVKWHASESYKNAAFAAYILGDFSYAVKMQELAVQNHRKAENYFLLAKYLARNKQINECVSYFKIAVILSETMLPAAFRELDLISIPEILTEIENLNSHIDTEINELLEINKLPKTKLFIELWRLNEINQEIKNLFSQDYQTKCRGISKIKSENFTSWRKVEYDIQDLKRKFSTEYFPNISSEEINEILTGINEWHDIIMENSSKFGKLAVEFSMQLSDLYENNVLRIGGKFGGGVVFYIDDSGKSGLVVSESDIGVAIWGASGRYNTGHNVGDGKQNTQIIADKASWHSNGIFSKKVEISTAAKLCMKLEANGFNDWYLPSSEEFKLLAENLCNHLSTEKYWSSSEDYGELDKAECYSASHRLTRDRNEEYYVIAIRSFNFN